MQTLTQQTNRKLTADSLRALSDGKVQEALKQLTPDQAQELQYDWSFWARTDQLEHESDSQSDSLFST